MATIVGKDPGCTRRCTCRKCGSIVEFTQIEVRGHTYKDYDGSTDTDYYIVCPGCTNKITISQYAKQSSFY